MLVKDIIYNDFCNYKLPSIFIIFPSCTFKCETECGYKICQNSHIAKMPNVNISISTIISHFKESSIAKSLVCGGLEPFDSWADLSNLIAEFREVTEADIVIYTGYNKEEIASKIDWLKQFPNITIKFGRYIPNQMPHYDEILGINLASDNQYAERIS